MFCEFMSEMRKPTDFWKGLICVQAVIYTCYATFGMVVYSFQGQFAFNPAMQGLTPYNWQIGVNIVFPFSGLIAACLYSNIGIKVDGATTAVLGIYSSVVSLIAGFEGRMVATSFGCAAPV